jgi:Zn-finger nucleic acid-binding protein
LYKLPNANTQTEIKACCACQINLSTAIAAIAFINSKAYIAYMDQTMKCPACDRPLEVTSVAGVNLNVCQHGCGGIWFDNHELKRILTASFSDNPPMLVVQRDESTPVDYTRKRLCPRCPNQPMLRHYFSKKCAIEVDECPACGGLWLDYGELATIHAELKGAASPPEKPPKALAIRQISQYLAGLRPPTHLTGNRPK